MSSPTRSPQSGGSYRFGQEMLRQVAYETLSKKDRKARHLAVAAHLRAAFANDGEEITDVIARHYLDALAVGPRDSDMGDVTAQALAFLVCAAERAERSGAPGRAAESYAEAAAIAQVDQAPRLFERAAQASWSYGDFDAAAAHADAARKRRLGIGDMRGAARAQSLMGDALQLAGLAGRHTAARTELTAALEVLRPQPDADTVTALRNLAGLEIHSGNLVEGEHLATEALVLGQALDVGDRVLGRCFDTKGVAAVFANRSVEAAADLREAARLAERTGDYGEPATVQFNLADVLPRTGDLPGAVDAARSAAAHARRTGRRDGLAFAVANLAVARMDLGEWHEADTALAEVVEVEHLDHELVRCFTGWLAGLRGDGERAASVLAAMPNRRQSENAQAQAGVGILEALVALSTGDESGALADAMGVLEKEEAIGIGQESLRWAWPLAARAARSLGNGETLGALIAMLDAHPVGHLPPTLRAERRLVAALVAADTGTPDALSLVVDAIAALREIANPYQLAHGLTDYAEVLLRAGEEGAAHAALAEAKDIAERLGCPPLLARVASVGAMSARADASH